MRAYWPLRRNWHDRRAGAPSSNGPALRSLTRGEIEAKCDFLRAAVRMKDEIVDRAALNEDVGIVRCEPMEIVDGQVMREHVAVLALHPEPAPVYGHRLPRATDDAEIPRFSGLNSEIERLDQLARTRIRSYRRRSLAGHQAGNSRRHDKEVFHIPRRSRRSERNLGNQVTALAKNLRAAHRELARAGVLHFLQFESPCKGNVSSVK